MRADEHASGSPTADQPAHDRCAGVRRRDCVKKRKVHLALHELKGGSGGFHSSGGRLLACISLLPLGLAGCATPIIHDDAVQARTTVVKEAWAKTDDAPYFKALRAEYTALQQQEDAALVRSLRATRDRNIASYVAPILPPNAALVEPIRGVSKLCHDVDRRLNEFVGDTYGYDSPDTGSSYACGTPAAANNLVPWSRLPNMISALRSGIVAAQRTHADAAAAFATARAAWREGPGVKATEPDLPLQCDKMPLAWVATGADSAAVSGVAALPDYPVSEFKSFVQACLGVDGKGGLIGALGELGPSGSVGRTVEARDGSILAILLSRTLEVRADAALSAMSAATVAPALAELQKQIDHAGTGKDAKAFKDAVEDLRRVLVNAPELARLLGSEKTATLIEQALKAELASAAEASTATAHPPAETADGTGSAAASPPATGEPPTVTTKRVEAILQLAEAGAALSDAARLSNPAKRVSALLILLAAQRQKIDMLQLAARREAERVAIADAEVLAGATELALLAEARLFLSGLRTTNVGVADVADRKGREAANSALNRMSLAWSEGRIPMNLARLRHVYLNRGYRISMAEKTTENWRSLIAPAIAQMSVAAEIGLTPKDWADLFTQLGIAGAILVK
jgi:hypothetical protein